MTPIDVLATLTFAAGLFAAGYVVGRAARPGPATAVAPAATPILAQVEVTMLQKSVRTDMTVDAATLEQIANGIGMYLVPLASRSVQ